VPRDVSVGIVGAGPMGRLHARTVCALAARGSRFELSRTLDRHHGRAQSLAAEFGGEAASDFDSFVRDVDVAIVAVPTRTHHIISIRLMEHGIDVLVEKPLAENVTEGEALVAATDAAKRILQVGHVEWYNAAWRVPDWPDELFERIEVDRFQPPSERGNDIDVIQDLMLHDLDWTTRVIDSAPVGIKAIGRLGQGGRVEAAEAELRFSDGRVVGLRASRMHSERRREARFYGVNKTAIVDLDDRCSAPYDAGSTGADAGLMNGNDPLESQWVDFIKACRSRVAPINHVRVGLDALQLVERVRDAITIDAGGSMHDNDSRFGG